jgi:malonyl CoA-acyl carrier protein transacylase
VTNKTDVVRTLSRQLTHRVRWEQTMIVLYAKDAYIDGRRPRTYELGPGNTLTGVLTRHNKHCGERAQPVDC